MKKTYLVGLFEVLLAPLFFTSHHGFLWHDRARLEEFGRRNPGALCHPKSAVLAGETS